VQPPEPTNTADSSVTPTSPLESESKDANTVKPEESKDEPENKVQDSPGDKASPEGEGKTPETPEAGTEPATAPEDKSVSDDKATEPAKSAVIVTPLSPPKDLNITGVIEKSVYLEWSPVDEAGDYQVQYQYSSNTKPHKLMCSRLPDTVVEKAKITTLVTIPTLDIKCTFQVCALDKKGAYGEWSDTKSVVPPPKGLKIEGDTKKSVSLKWLPVDGADGYEFLYDEDESNCKWTNALKKSGEKTEIPVPCLDSGTKYTFQVRATCKDGVSDWSVPVPVVPPPKDLRIPDDNITADSVSLTWSPVVGADKYKVRYKHDGGSWLPENDVAPPKDKETKITTTVDSLTCATNYEFQVCATNKDSNPIWSDSVYVKTESVEQKSSNACLSGCLLGVVLLALAWIGILVALWFLLPNKPAPSQPDVTPQKQSPMTGAEIGSHPLYYNQGQIVIINLTV